MSNMLTDTMHAAKDGLESAKDGTKHAYGTAKHGLESAGDSTMKTVSGAFASVAQGVAAVAGVITTLQKLDRDDGLAWLGLSRRRSPLFTFALLGAGAVVGVGVALWFAPMSGADLRGMFLRKTKEAEKNLESRAEVLGDAAMAAAKGVKDDMKHLVDPSDGAGHKVSTLRT